MELLVQRDPSTDQSTEGQLWIDGQPFGYTLEDVVRDVKIQNETAIPDGRYQVTIDQSPKFGRLMPHVLNVPGYTGVRIHWGNTAKDTDGCVLVGWERGDNFIGTSRAAFDQLYEQLHDAIEAGEQAWLTIKNPG